MKTVLTIILMASLVLSFAGCKKKEEKVQPPPEHPSMQGGMPMGSMAGTPKKERAVVVPKEVKATWASVKFVVEDKEAKTAKEYSVAVGSDLAVPNTKMKIRVLAFLPDFKMNENDITSASNKPNNPAAQVLVQEPGKEEWKGWLFASHSNIHPFPHEKISLKLIGGVQK